MGMHVEWLMADATSAELTDGEELGSEVQPGNMVLELCDNDIVAIEGDRADLRRLVRAMAAELDGIVTFAEDGE